VQKPDCLCGRFLLAALRIHCSDQCKQMLDKLGGYILEPRGTVTIKVLDKLGGYILEPRGTVTIKVLDKLGGYILEPRGTVTIKVRPLRRRIL